MKVKRLVCSILVLVIMCTSVNVVFAVLCPACENYDAYYSSDGCVMWLRSPHDDQCVGNAIYCGTELRCYRCGFFSSLWDHWCYCDLCLLSGCVNNYSIKMLPLCKY